MTDRDRAKGGSLIDLGMCALFHVVDIDTTYRSIGRICIGFFRSAPRGGRAAANSAESSPADAFAIRTAIARAAAGAAGGVRRNR